VHDRIGFLAASPVESAQRSRPRSGWFRMQSWPAAWISN
jgi:hypothetical protein